MRTACSISRWGERVSTRQLLWPSAPPPRPYQKATFNQKATKPEWHNRRPQQKATPPQSRHPPLGADPPRTRHPPQETCCKARWDTTCNACWDSTPPWTESQMPVKTLPCPNFVAGGNKSEEYTNPMSVCLNTQPNEPWTNIYYRPLSISLLKQNEATTITRRYPSGIQRLVSTHLGRGGGGLYWLQTQTF